MTTAEQKARDMLERIGVEDAQTYSAGELVELANMIVDAERIEKWKNDGEALVDKQGFSAAFALGVWWADRPWRSMDR